MLPDARELAWWCYGRVLLLNPFVPFALWFPAQMPEPLLYPVFLVIDHNPEGRLLLGRTLLRKFPTAILQECDTVEAALAALKKSRVDAVVSHRVIGFDGATTVAMIRQAHPDLPIVMVSGVDRAQEARAAGASEFIRFDAWLTVGSVVDRLLSARTVSKEPMPSQGERE